MAKKQTTEVAPVESQSLNLFDDKTKGNVLTLAGKLEAIVAIGKIETQETKDAADSLLKDATKSLKAVSEVRLGFTRKLDEKKKLIMAEEARIIEPLKNAVDALGAMINAFNREAEAKRAAELKRLENEAKERLRKELEERERRANLQQKVLNLEAQCLERLTNATLETIDKAEAALRNWTPAPESWEDFTEAALAVKNEILAKFPEQKQILIDAQNDAEAAAYLEEQRKGTEQVKEETERAIAEVQADLEAEKMSAQVGADMLLQAQAQSIPQNSGIKKVWSFEVVDPAQVPAQYWSIDPAKIKEAVKNGERNIAGVNIFEDVQRTGR